MAQDFIDADGDGIGKVQTAGVGDHRNPHCRIRVLVEKGFWQTSRFFAEK